MVKNSIIEQAYVWRKTLAQDIFLTSGQTASIDNISCYTRRLICNLIISRMLFDRGIPDNICWMLDMEPHHLEFSPKVVSQIKNEINKINFNGLSFECLSDVYESFLTKKLKLLPCNNQLEYSPSTGAKKKRGIYYTPDYIVNYVVDHTLGRYLWGTEDGKPGEVNPKNPDDISSLKILDPACGSGSFLAYAFDVLAHFYSRYDPDNKTRWHITILQKHLYGVDLDSDAVDITGVILKLKALEGLDQIPDNLPEPNVKHGNFLIPDPDCKAFFDGGFTMILGNPPYGAKLSKSERKLINSQYQTCKSSDSSSLFIEKSINLLNQNGILGFVVPKSLSYVVSWQPIRGFLLEECRIIEIADASKAFKNVRLEQMVIITQKNHKPGRRTTVSVLRPENLFTSHTIDRSSLSSRIFSIWVSNRMIRDIVDKMWENSTPLGQIARIWNGLNIRNLPVFSDELNSKHHIPCLRGRHIARYRIRPNIQYVKLDGSFENGRASLETFCKPRIVAQDIVAYIKSPKPHIKIMATIDRSEKWINVNTVTNISDSEYQLEYLCGILNSRLISWYAYDFIYNRSIRTMHFRNGYADQLPISCINQNDPEYESLYSQMVDKVSRLITVNEQKSISEIEIAELDRQIEGLVYQLYGITEDDIKFLREHAGLY
jgi:type I restriction-modification system DNA methylase subunit